MIEIVESTEVTASEVEVDDDCVPKAESLVEVVEDSPVPKAETVVEVPNSEDMPQTSLIVDGSKAKTASGITFSKGAALKSSTMIVIPRASSTVSSPKAQSKRKKGKGKDSGTSSEEERWLDAIESGKLEEVDDELKKIKPKDPKLMTARQRAMFERKTDKEPSPGGERLLALPSGYKEKVMTAEALQKALLKSQKRKQLADEKREKDKKKTMDRLLKKQESKSGKGSRTRSIRKDVPRVTYCNNAEGITISLPCGMEFPLNPQKHEEKRNPPGEECCIEGCTNIKKYACSKRGVPLCSFSCYMKYKDLLLTNEQEDDEEEEEEEEEDEEEDEDEYVEEYRSFV